MIDRHDVSRTVISTAATAPPSKQRQTRVRGIAFREPSFSVSNTTCYPPTPSRTPLFVYTVCPLTRKRVFVSSLETSSAEISSRLHVAISRRDVTCQMVSHQHVSPRANPGETTRALGSSYLASYHRDLGLIRFLAVNQMGNGSAGSVQRRRRDSRFRKSRHANMSFQGTCREDEKSGEAQGAYLGSC